MIKQRLVRNLACGPWIPAFAGMTGFCMATALPLGTACSMVLRMQQRRPLNHAVRPAELDR
ncbi:MAG TPA: hypothetical protein VIE35_13285, partial [Dongiaceae bacterium]